MLIIEICELKLALEKQGFLQAFFCHWRTWFFYEQPSELVIYPVNLIFRRVSFQRLYLCFRWRNSEVEKFGEVESDLHSLSLQIQRKILWYLFQLFIGLHKPYLSVFIAVVPVLVRHTSI